MSIRSIDILTHVFLGCSYSQLAISVRVGTCLLIEECRQVRSPKNDPHHWKNLCIEEPFDFTNTARSVYDVDTFEKIKYVFAHSYQQLQQTLNLKSILDKKFVAFPMYPVASHYGHHSNHSYHQPHNHFFGCHGAENSYAPMVGSPAAIQ